MAEIVNLRRARKARARAAESAAADSARVRHGRTIEQKRTAAEMVEKLRKTVDDHRLERDEAGGKPHEKRRF